MNPFEYWYNTNPELKKFMDDYFNEHIELLNEYPQLKKDCETLFTEGKGSERVQVLTVIDFLIKL